MKLEWALGLKYLSIFGINQSAKIIFNLNLQECEHYYILMYTLK